jgi:hypothetical protein
VVSNVTEEGCLLLVHRNARRSGGRLILVQRVLAGRRVAQVAKELGVSQQCASLAVPVPTARHSFGEVGRRAVTYILDLMEGTSPPPVQPVEPRLMVRASAGSAALG